MGVLLTGRSGPASARGPTVQERERDLEEKARRQQMIEQHMRERAAEPAVGLPSPVQAPELGGARFPITQIEVRGGARHSREIGRIIKRYQGTTMGKAEIFALLRDLMNFYYGRGYITTGVSLAEQNLSSGKLILVVHWGYVKGWRVNGKAPEGMRERLMLSSAMPGIVGAVLNIHDIDQAIENLNGLGKAAKINVVSAEEAGHSYLDVVLQRSKPFSVSALVDNSGLSDQASDGLYKYGVNIAVADLLVGNDVLTLSAGRRHYKDPGHNAYDSLDVSYGLRVGRWSADLRYIAQPTKSLLSGTYGDYQLSGNTQDANLRVSRVLERWQTGKNAVYVAIDRKRVRNYIDDTLIEINSNTHTSVTVGVNRQDSLFGGTVFADGGWTRGVGWLGASEDPVSAGQGPMSRYDKFNLNLNWSSDFMARPLRARYTVAVGAQYSKDDLYYDSKFAIGDQYTVRGFKIRSAYGDSGVYVSNTLSFPLLTSIGSVTPLVGVDWGAVGNKGETGNGGWIGGAAGGVRVSTKWANAAMTIGKPFRALPGIGYGVVWYLSASVNY
ncbi:MULTISPECIES: ShlB/FhaC/HecB family hemolysin secretion/activation protein [Burkholderia]|uniref:ShlB/FhaC/HecB family hemolysin secretion/activation protein n=1 Tax=Burkholderia TaxID=32008 RepID=UPI00158D3EC5|nr:MULTISPECIES: ShlB/FhaC/HecB family hemolysin secretion/activation protein [Burkholderia]MCU9952164.1 ShlB/FhaC/HecB family hemolysin secretion/activation protein [Burkholderia sp. BKH01]